MANQRKASKRKLQIWLEEDERKMLAEIASQHGFETVTAFLQAVATGAVNVTQRPKSTKRAAGGKKRSPEQP